MAIFKIDLHNGHRSLLTNYRGLNTSPVFSPNGHQMAVALSQPNSAKTDIYLLDLNSHTMKRLTHLGSNTSPSFLDNGQQLMFTSNRGGSLQVYKINLTDNQISRITFQGAANYEAKPIKSSPWVVMMHREKNGGPIQLVLMNLKNNVIKPITSGPLDKSPSVSPNGSMVVYESFENGHSRLKEVAVANGVGYTLPNRVGQLKTPSWSPYLTPKT